MPTFLNHVILHSKRTLSCLVVCALSSCALQQVDLPPTALKMDPTTVSAGRAIKHSAQEGISWPQYEWWEAYHDPQLDQLVQEAIANNPTLNIAKARITRTQFQAKDVHSILYPTIEASADLTRQRFTENQFYRAPYAGNVDWNNLVTSEFNYQLDLWGRNRAALAASLDLVQVASAEKREVQLALQTAVVRTYLRLSLNYILRDVAQRTLQQRQEILEITTKKFDAGLTTEIDRSQAETPLPSARGELDKINAEIALLQTELSVLTGKGPGDGERLTRPQINLLEPVGLPSSLPADLIARRPDIVAGKWLVEAQRQHIHQAKAAFYPNINLRAFLGWQSIGFSQLLNGSSVTYGIAPALNLPIFDGGHLNSQLGVAKSEYDIAVESYNQCLLHALEEISNQLVLLQSLDHQRTEALRGKQLAEHAYAIALKGYRAGLTNYLSVLNAQEQTLLQTNHCAQIDAQYLDAYCMLMQALGGGVLDPKHV